MSLGTLVFITPHPAASPGLPTRPASLLAEFVATGAFDDVVVVNRLRPAAIARRIGGVRPIVRGGLPGLATKLPNGTRLIEHPWPFCRLERRFLGGVLQRTAASANAPVVVWVADPKSVPAVVQCGRRARPWRVVVDAYDAWDRSPLVRGRRRREAVLEGYRAAAAADLVFANTPAMRDRLVALGAIDVRVLPNASPLVDTAVVSAGSPKSLIYVGRIHERFDAELASAVAAALPGTTFTIAGPVEREPAGWGRLASQANVRLAGRVDPAEARRMVAAAAAVLIPHRVDDYTRSQDAMKAWDAIAVGTPVISTPIPPVDDWPIGLAEVCPDADTFIAAAGRAVAGEFEAGRARRLLFAAENQWSSRAATAIAAMRALAGSARQDDP